MSLCNQINHLSNLDKVNLTDIKTLEKMESSDNYIEIK